MNETILPPFEPWPKMARLSREIIVSEKIDGTNAQVFITEYGEIFAGSRTRWITPTNDNYGFAQWVVGNKEELLKLGPGRWFGEWWGNGIQRNYGLKERRFSLFNTFRWIDQTDEERSPDDKAGFCPPCCCVVPVLYRGLFDTEIINATLRGLEVAGSVAAPGFLNPEGIVIYHIAAGVAFKKTIKHDEQRKSDEQKPQTKS